MDEYLRNVGGAQCRCLAVFLGKEEEVNNLISKVELSSQMKLKWLDSVDKIPKKKPSATPSRTIGGLWKKSWFKKHEEIVPSVVSFVYNLDSDDVEKEKEGSSWEDEAVKSLYISRLTRFFYFFITTEAQLTPSMEERISTWKKQHVQPQQYSSIVLVTDNDFSRARKHLLHAGHSFCKDSTKRLRKILTEKGLSMKSGDPGMLCHYKFKMGFFAECRERLSRAKKHYSEAYTSLMNHTNEYFAGGTIDPNYSFECVALAEYINFRLCLVLLKTNKRESGVEEESVSLNEAMHQHNDHIKWSVMLPVSEKWEFWKQRYIARQYEMWGEKVAELLDGYVSFMHGFQFHRRLGNPAFYFHAAANCTMYERNSFEKEKDVVLIVNTSVEPETPYLGQEYTLGLSRILRREEDEVNHTEKILELLKKAHHFYEEAKLSRMVRGIDAQIAFEYFHRKDYVTAKKHFDVLAKSYGRETWRQISASARSYCLECNKILGEYFDGILCAMELASERSQVPEEEKKKYYQQIGELGRLLCSKSENLSVPREIIVSDALALVSVDIRFSRRNVFVGEHFSYDVIFRSHSSCDIVLREVKTWFNDCRYDCYSESEFVLSAYSVHSITFNCDARGSERLHATDVTATSVIDSVNMKWRWILSSSSPECRDIGVVGRGMKSVCHDSSILKIDLPPSLMKISLVCPTKLYPNEVIPAELHLRWPKGECLEGFIQVQSSSLLFVDNRRNPHTKKSAPIPPWNDDVDDDQFDISVLPMDIKCPSAGLKKLHIRVSYKSPFNIGACKDETIKIMFSNPLSIRSSFSPLGTRGLFGSENVLEGDDLLCELVIENKSENEEFKLISVKVEAKEEYFSCSTPYLGVSGTVISPGDLFRCSCPLQCLKAGHNISPGIALFNYSRLCYDGADFSCEENRPRNPSSISFRLPLVPVSVVERRWSVKCDVAMSVVERVPFDCAFVITNWTEEFEHINISMDDDSLQFSFTGPKTLIVTIPPKEDLTVYYCFVAMSPGHGWLPSLRVRSQVGTEQSQSTAKMRRVSVFVRPFM